MAHATGAVLAVIAHPDDEVLCGAGTLALCRAQGREVSLVCATRGELGPISDAQLANRATLAAVRERELLASCEVLGIHDVHHLGLPDAGVAWAAQTRDALAELVQLIRTQRPRVAITFGPDGLYGHTDHVAVNELMIEARRAAADPGFDMPAARNPLQPFWIPRLFYPVMTAEYVIDLLSQLSAAGRDAQLWALRASDFHVPSSAISTSVDVSSVLDRKLRALHSHRTQLAPDNALRLLSGELAVRFLGVEHFRCADGQPGNPLTD